MTSGVPFVEASVLVAVEVRRPEVRAEERLVALLPVAEQVGAGSTPTRRRPRGTPPQRGKRSVTPPRNRLRKARWLLREVAEVVAHEARRQAPVGPAHAAAVARHRDAEVDEPLPHGVVVVRAVDTERADVHARNASSGCHSASASSGRATVPPVTSTFSPSSCVLELLDGFGRLGQAHHPRPRSDRDRA